MHIERGDGRVTLYFEQSPNQQAMAGLHALMMGGFVCALLYGAIYRLLHAPASQSLPVALFFVGCAALAAWNGWTSMLEQNYTTVFDLRARTVTLTEGGIITRQRGPVSFDDIVGVGTRVGFAVKHRSVIAELMLASGDQWRVGYELIWLRPASTSEIPDVIADLRKATGLSGSNSGD
jgi:hypothetical protein